MGHLFLPDAGHADDVGSLEFAALREGYRTGRLTPAGVVAAVYARIAARGDDAVWIALVPEAVALAQVAALGEPDDLPLWGIPFAVKDNIDVADMPTTAACPAFAYLPERGATLVDRLTEAGAILIGKTNLDQFATGLNGTRSPYGIPSTPFDPASISGGSSSGSAVAVSAGLVSFAIGTDTAGSGRVPAALTNTVGVKPSRGLVSTAGILPACRSLDCASVFALTVADGAQTLAVLAGTDPIDPWSRDFAELAGYAARPLEGARLGVPELPAGTLSAEHQAAWADLLARLAGAGADLVGIDFAAFAEAGSLLYQGPWVAERYALLKDFVEAQGDEIHPVVRGILRGGAEVSGADVFRGVDQLRAARRDVEEVLAGVDAVLTPTVPRTFTIAELLDDPLGANTVLGTFTMNANLLDLAAVAVPGGATAAGMPFGAMLLADAGSDAALLALAGGIEELVDLPLGATGFARLGASTGHAREAESSPDALDVLVVGAHLSGMPLNGRLAELGAALIGPVRTAAEYRLYALPDGLRPGLVRVGPGGRAIDAEIYRLPSAKVGEFVAEIGAPLSIGTVRLENGAAVHGFLCEPAGLDGAEDITAFGGWRSYREAYRR